MNDETLLAVGNLCLSVSAIGGTLFLIAVAFMLIISAIYMGLKKDGPHDLKPQKMIRAEHHLVPPHLNKKYF